MIFLGLLLVPIIQIHIHWFVCDRCVGTEHNISCVLCGASWLNVKGAEINKRLCLPLSHSRPPQFFSHVHSQGALQVPWTQPGYGKHSSQNGPCQPKLHLQGIVDRKGQLFCISSMYSMSLPSSCLFFPRSLRKCSHFQENIRPTIGGTRAAIKSTYKQGRSYIYSMWNVLSAEIECDTLSKRGRKKLHFFFTSVRYRKKKQHHFILDLVVCNERYCSVHVSRAAGLLSAFLLWRKLSRGQTWNERRNCGTRVRRLEGEARGGLANLLVYGSTLLFQGQR